MKQKYYDNEIPKYFKKKNPSISKAKEKSKHKHLYIDCLLIEDGRPYKSTYCTVCGKIKNTKFGEFVLLGIFRLICFWLSLTIICQQKIYVSGLHFAEELCGS